MIIARHLDRFINDPFIISYSGGADSTVFSYFLKQNKRANFGLFHFNHKYYHQDDEIELRAREYADWLGVPIYVETATDYPLNVDRYGVEGAGSYARRKALFNTWQNNLPFNPAKYVFCHQLNDCVENYLMGSFQGKENNIIKGLTDWGQHGIIYRPFLLTPKTEVRRFAEQWGLDKFILEDGMNEDTRFNRNWVRTIIPDIQARYGIEKVVRKKVMEMYGNG